MRKAKTHPAARALHRLQRLARERADQQARRVPWKRLLETRKQYIDWQEFIVGRSGDEIIVKFGSGAELAFQLTDNTQVSQIGELFNARRKQMAMAALIPGLKAKARPLIFIAANVASL